MKYLRLTLAWILVLLMLFTSCSVPSNDSESEESTTAATQESTTESIENDQTPSEEEEEEEELEAVKSVDAVLPLPYIDIDFDESLKMFDKMDNVSCTLADKAKGFVVSSDVKFNGESYSVPHFKIKESGGAAVLEYKSLSSSDELLSLLGDGFAVIEKSDFLPASVRAPDLRGGAALLMAAIYADGESVIEGADLIKRGYGKIIEKLRRIGVDIKEF